MYAEFSNVGIAKPYLGTATITTEKEYDVDPVGVFNIHNIRDRAFVYWVAGTFGLLSPAYVQANTATSNWSINQIQIDKQNYADEEVVGSVASELAHIRELTKISVTELARVFGVSRQAVHDWLNNGSISGKNAQKVSNFAQAIDVLLRAGFEVSPQVLRRKFCSDGSILDAIQKGGRVVEMANLLAVTLAREADQRRRLTERLAGRQKPDLADTEFGAPHLNENG